MGVQSGAHSGMTRLTVFLLAVSLVVCLAFPAEAAYSKYFSWLQDANGKAITGALVYVRNPDASLATIYSDAAGAMAKGNPFATNTDDGQFWFYAATGRYSLTFIKAGYSFRAADTADLPLGVIADSYTVATLPAGGQAGRLVRVTDGTASLYIDDGATFVPLALDASRITGGLLGAARGGTGLDTSGSTGTPRVDAGTWSVGTPIANSSTVAGLPAAAIAGRIYRLSDGGASGALVVDDGTTIRCDDQKASNRINVRCPPYNAKGDNTTNDTAAIAAAFTAAQSAAQGSAGTPNGSGGATVNVGGTVFFPEGRYRVTNLSPPPYITILGEGRYASVIVQNTATATNNPVMDFTIAGWVTIRDIGVETTSAASSNQHCFGFVRSGTAYGIKVVMDNIQTYQCQNAINIIGNTTNSSFTNLFIRSPAASCIHQDATGSGSATVFSTIYCSAPASHGIHLEGGCGNCVFTGIITEATVGDGMRLVNISRSTFTSSYLGDLVQGNGLHLRDSFSNTFVGTFSTQGATSLSHIVLDGSYGNTFTNTRLEACDRYSVEWLNTSGTADPSTVLRANTFDRIIQDGLCTLGFSNDETYIEVHHTVRAPVEPWITSPAAANTIPWYEDQAVVDGWHWRTPANAPSTAYANGYAPPVGSERWSFLRDWGGAAAATPGGGIRPYSLMGRNATNLIGTLPSTETLGSALITGDDSTCTAGIGAWVLGFPADTTFTSVAGGQAGNGCQYKATTSGGLTYVSLSVTTTAGKLYKGSFYGNNITYAGDSNPRLFMRVFDSGAANQLASTQFIRQQSGFAKYTFYFVAADATSILRLTNSGPINGETWIVDTFEMKEVTSDGAFCLSGGRRDVTSVGGGGNLCLYGDAHATKPLAVEQAGQWVAVPSAVQAITVAGDTITVANAELKLISNTTAGPIALTSAPTIANGLDGQTVRILNTGTQPVILQDQAVLASSNLRLQAGAVAIGALQSIQLTYSSTVGDWVATSAPSFAGVRTLSVSTVSTGNVGSGEDTLISYSLPANSLLANGQTLEWTAAGTIFGSASSKRLRCYFGASLLIDTTALAIAATADWRLTATIVRTGAATQKAIAAISSNNALLVSTTDYTTPAETLSAAVAVQCTGTSTGAPIADNDLVQEMNVVKQVN